MSLEKFKFCSPFILLILLAILPTCSQPDSGTEMEEANLPDLPENELPLEWADLTLYITKNTPANSPTFASRAFGYIGLTMYETVVNGYPVKRSLAGQLNQIDPLPLPEKGKLYNWKLALNAGQAAILKNIYQQASDENKLKIDSLEQRLETVFSRKESDQQVVKRSIDFGRKIASAIYEWSKDDGGHRGYLNNFDSNMEQKRGKGYWRPPFFAQTISRLPLHPYWGENRTFIKANADWKMPDFMLYDSLEGSAYYNGFYEVYEHNQQLTQEQKEIAMWWNDDPTDTFTPPGHSYNLVNIILKNNNYDLITSAEAFARVGLAVADAFMVCWKVKYHYFTERPSTFVSENIDDEWEPFWPDPPFPAFPSGHATQAGAVATVLSDFFGEEMSFIDNTHSDREKDKIRNVEYKDRSFNSFWEVAEETAYSRFLGGIHSQYDNEVGLSEGQKVGNNINNLKWDN